MQLRRLALLFFVACKSDPVVITTADVCAVDSDCTLTSLGEDCCDHCGERALTKKAEADLRARCKDKHPRCPDIDCKTIPSTAKCVSSQCIAAH